MKNMLALAIAFIGGAAAEASDSSSYKAADLARAAQMVPRPAFRGNDFSEMVAALNDRLQGMAGVTAKPCAEFSAQELQALQGVMHPKADEKLLAIYARQDAKRLATRGRARQGQSLQELEAKWAGDSALVAGAVGDALHTVYRDGLCHETVMWFVHHLQFDQRQQIAQQHTLPLLPHTQHLTSPAELAAAANVTHAAAGHILTNYQASASCTACHVSKSGNAPAAPATPRKVGEPPLPSWGGALAYKVPVTLTAHDVVISGASWNFTYFYSSSPSHNYSRYDHVDGQEDEVCHGVDKSTKACTTIFSNAQAFIITDVDGKAPCCSCSVAGGYGAVRSDWLRGAAYQGATTVNGFAVDQWLKQGASDNHYYATRDSAQRPVRFMEHKNGLLKQWDFDTVNFSPGPQDVSHFTPPASCPPCRASFCI